MVITEQNKGACNTTKPLLSHHLSPQLCRRCHSSQKIKLPGEPKHSTCNVMSGDGVDFSFLRRTAGQHLLSQLLYTSSCTALSGG